MKIIPVHPLPVPDDQFLKIQEELAGKLDLSLFAFPDRLRRCAGVDLAYWKSREKEVGVCSIVVIDFVTLEVKEKVSAAGTVDVPYRPGFLAFRELPLVLKAVKKLTAEPDVFLFDGNGCLHPRQMGIATHAAFFLNKPAIGVAKSYFQLENASFDQPGSQKGSFTDITDGEAIYGRAVRTRDNVKPVFVSAGNFITLEAAVGIVLQLTEKNSRQPVPLRLADIESRRLKREAVKNISE